MMKNLRYLFSTLLLLLVAGVTWADSKTLTVNLTGFGGTAIGYATNISAQDEDATIYFTANNFVRSNGQVRGNQTSLAGNFNIANTEEVPGYITGIKIETTTGTGTFSAAMSAAVGTTSQASATLGTAGTRASDNKFISWTFDASSKYTYFRLFSAAKFTNGSVTGCVITITYEEASAGSMLLDPNLAFAQTSGTVALDEAATLPALTNDGDGDVTYSSSETGVATIDENSGAITLVGIGTTVITAISAATDTYKAGSAEYTLTVIPGGTIIWSEDFSSEDLRGYTIVNGGSETKLYAANLAGGESPELLIGKTSGSFTATIPLQGYYGNLTLGFRANASDRVTVSSTTDGVTIGTQSGESPYYYTISVPSGTANLVLTFSNTNSNNVRVDDFVLYGITQSSLADPEFSFGATTSFTVKTSEVANFIAPTLSTAANYDGTIIYTSSNTDLARVNSTTGEITFVENATGSVTITASAEATDNFLAGEASYTVNVVAPLTIAEFTALADNTVGLLSLEGAQVVYKNGNNMYVRDNTGAIEFYNSDLDWEIGDILTGEITATKSSNRNNPQVGTISENNASVDQSGTATAKSITYAEAGSNLNDLVTFTFDDISNSGSTYYVDGDHTVQIYNKFNIEGLDLSTLVNGTTYTVEGIAIIYNQQVEICPTKVIEEAAVPSYYLIGSFNKWAEDSKVEFTYNASTNTYTLANQAIEAGGEFKILDGDGNWYGGPTPDEHYTIHSEWFENLPMATDGKNYYIADGNNYTFTIGFTDEGAPRLTVTGWPEPAYYLTGDFNNWGNDIEFTYDENTGNYVATRSVSNGDEFKVKYGVPSKPNDFTWYGGDTNGNGNYVIHDEWYTDIPMSTSGENFEIQLSEPATLTFTLTVNPTAAPTLTVTGWPVPPVPGVEKYVLVTDASTLAAGDEIIFVGEKDGTYYSINLNTNANNRRATAITCDGTTASITTGTGVVDDDINVFTLEAGTSPVVTWMFKGSDDNYLTSVTANSNHLKLTTSPGENAEAIVTIDTEGTSVVFQGTGARKTMQFNYNNGSPIFACYASASQSPVAIYKKTLITSVDVTIGETGYATMYYSDMNLVVPAGVTATTYTVTNGALAESWMYEEGDVIPAGTGVVLNTAKPSTYTFTATTEDGDVDPDNMLTGTDVATTIDAAGYKYYILSKDKAGQKVGFYYQNEDGSAVNNGAHKAYLPVPVEATGGAKGWSFDGDATGINTINGNETLTNNEVYNLSGVRMSGKNLPKGIYIVNGKKMVVK